MITVLGLQSHSLVGTCSQTSKPDPWVIRSIFTKKGSFSTYGYIEDKGKKVTEAWAGGSYSIDGDHLTMKVTTEKQRPDKFYMPTKPIVWLVTWEEDGRLGLAGPAAPTFRFLYKKVAEKSR